MHKKKDQAVYFMYLFPETILFNFYWLYVYNLVETREMENISRGPIFRDFVTILTERSMQDVTVERFRVIFTAIVIARKIVQCYCVHRVR